MTSRRKPCLSRLLAWYLQLRAKRLPTPVVYR
jgi:hypothetical protein